MRPVIPMPPEKVRHHHPHLDRDIVDSLLRSKFARRIAGNYQTLNQRKR